MLGLAPRRSFAGLVPVVSRAVALPRRNPTVSVSLTQMLSPTLGALGTLPTRPQNYLLLEKQFGVNAWVYICVRRKGRDLASAPWVAYRRDGEDTRTPLTPQDPLQQLLRRPNPWMTMSQLTYITSMYLDLTGNCFWLIIRDRRGVPTELYPVNPFSVQIYQAADQLVSRYAVFHYGRQLPLRAFTPQGPGDLVHFKLDNPTSDLGSMFPSPWGVGPLEAAWSQVRTDDDMVRWNRNLVANEGRPSGLLTSDMDVDDATADEAAERYRSTFGGPDGAGKVLVLGRNLKYEKLAFNARELDFVKARTLIRQEIIAVFDLNSTVLGLTEGDVGRRDEQIKDYWQGTVVSTSETDICQVINEYIAPAFGEDRVVAQDFSHVRALQFNDAGRVATAKDLWSMGVPFKDVNERLDLGFSEFPGWEKSWISISVSEAGVEPQPKPGDAIGLPPAPGEEDDTVPGVPVAEAPADAPKPTKVPAKPQAPKA